MHSNSPRMLPAAAAAALAVILIGCAGGPAPSGPPPQWIAQRPQDDQGYFYFTGSGTSATGDLNEARATATGEVMAEIMRYIGVRVTADTEAKARSDLNTFQASVEQTVRQTGSARVAGLEIQDTWVDNRNRPASTVHMLVRYQKPELLKEKQRLEALFQEVIDSVAVPEQNGDKLVSSGRHYEAALSYITAADASTKEGIENADVKFKRNVGKAIAAVEKLSLLKLNDNIKTMAGQAFAEPLRARLVAGAVATDPGVPDASIRVTYNEVNAGTGRTRVRTQDVATDSGGVATFQHPVPTFVGAQSVDMSLDMTKYTELLYDAPRAFRDQVDALEQLAISRKISFRISVDSMARTVPTGVLILDYDRTGALAGIWETGSSLQSGLSGFSLRTLSFTNAELAGKSVDDVVALVRARYAAQVQRLVIGSTRIVDVSRREGRTFARAEADVQVVDLATGAVLLSTGRQKSGMGTAEADAQNRAYRDIGRELGEDIANRLP